jgi:hypothetical protein
MKLWIPHSSISRSSGNSSAMRLSTQKKRSASALSKGVPRIE